MCGEANVELWHGFLATMHVASSTPCRKARRDAVLTNVCFGEVQSLLLVAVEGQHASETCVQSRLLLQPIKAIQ